MALERVGLGGTLIFDAKPAIQGMSQAQRASLQLRDEQGRFIRKTGQAGAKFDGFGGKIRKVAGIIKGAARRLSGAGAALGAATRTIGLAALPLTAVFGLAFKKAADFEQAMSGVGAVAGASAKEMAELTAEAKRIGATTVNSASQAAEGMEALARAGFSASEVVAAMGGVADAAAADGITLGTAAGIVASTIRGMGLEAGQAARVSDVLAKASASANTDIVSLGESLKLSTATAKGMGIQLPELTTALAALADAGTKGTSAGTSLVAALNKISKPTTAGAEAMKKYNIALSKNEDGSLDLLGTMANVSKGLDGIRDLTKKNAITSDLFGVRGKKAFAAIEAAIKSGKSGPLLAKLQKQFLEGGAAADMAAKRLDNFKGQTKLLSSALEGLAIETAGQFLNSSAGKLKDISKGVGDVVLVLQLLNGEVSESDKRWKGLSPTVIGIARGIHDAFGIVIKAIRFASAVVVSLAQLVAGKTSSDMTRSISKWGTLFLLVAALVAPIVIALGGLVAFIAIAVLPAIKAILVIMAIVGAGVAVAVALGTAALVLFSKKGESVGQTMKRIFNLIKAAILGVIRNAIMPLVNAFLNVVRPAIDKMWVKARAFIVDTKRRFQIMISAAIQGVRKLTPVFKAVFAALGFVIGKLFQGWLILIGAVLAVMTPLFRVLKKIAVFLVNQIVNKVIMFVKLLTKAADALGKGDLIPPGLRELAKSGSFNVDESLEIDEAAGIDLSPDAKGILDGFLGGIGSALASKGALAAKGSKTEVDLKIEDKRKIETSACVNLDGREVGRSQAQQQLELTERSGFKVTPWQRRLVIEQGAIPVITGGK